MIPTRRSLLKLSGASILGTGFLSRLDRVAAMQKAPTLRDIQSWRFNRPP